MVEVAEYLNCIGVQCDIVFSSVVNRKVPDLGCAMKHLKAGLKRARRRRAFGTWGRALGQTWVSFKSTFRVSTWEAPADRPSTESARRLYLLCVVHGATVPALSFTRGSPTVRGGIRAGRRMTVPDAVPEGYHGWRLIFVSSRAPVLLLETRRNLFSPLWLPMTASVP